MLHLDGYDLLHCDMEGLCQAKEDSRYIWYALPYSDQAEYWAAFVLWTEWLLQNPDYSVDTEDYQYHNLCRKLFPY